MRSTVCLVFLLLAAFVAPPAAAQHSVARQWNEVLLAAIRKDFARPTVHARNLFHVSVAMYDAWAVYDDRAQTYLLGKTVHGFRSPFYGVPRPADVAAARREAISYACYRLLRHRFRQSPGVIGTEARIENLMRSLGYDPAVTSTDYAGGSPAALGNYIAQEVIAYGLQDHSNERNRYENLYYAPVNPPMTPTLPGNPTIVDMNRWQPLTLDFIDQSGNPFPTSTPHFLSPEWGRVLPFALTEADRTIIRRDGFDFWDYHDPGMPPQLDTLSGGGSSDDYKWGFVLVSMWSSHLDPADGVMWDISPASIGNAPPPETITDYRQFFDRRDGGDAGPGRPLNPKTGQPYVPQIVPRGDYARVLAEFWADGPESETPPGHWYVILNYVTDHSLFARRFEGAGPVLDPLEWDVKSYFALGGAVHDAAVATWGIKGCYDYIRPISAIRGMARYGQSTDPGAPRYHPAGLPLVPGYVELVSPGDPLAGPGGEHVKKLKLYAWRGPYAVEDPDNTTAGVGWILADEWWPYQRPTFVTPPFAGYTSGHSTFSRAAAEVLARLTGDEYFPGGLGEFVAPRNEFLVFEDGPSVDVTLQWATYADASDQTSLSRIWGGIHPPADDIPGRKIGRVIGPAAFALAKQYFAGAVQEPRALASPARVYPNPVAPGGAFTVELDRPRQDVTIRILDLGGRLLRTERRTTGPNQRFVAASAGDLSPGLYFVLVTGAGWQSAARICILQ